MGGSLTRRALELPPSPLAPQMRSLVAALALAMVAASARAAPEAAHDLNVINFILDDWGWGDIGAYGASWSGSGTKIRTPNLDKLAAQGTLFTQYKVSQGFCAPSVRRGTVAAWRRKPRAVAS